MFVIESAPHPVNSSSLLARIGTAIVLIPLLVGVIWFGSFLWVSGLFGLFLIFGAYEWAALIDSPNATRRLYVIGTFALIAALATGFENLTLRVSLLASACGWWLVATVMVLAAQLGVRLLPSDRRFLAVLGWLVLIPSYFALLWLYEAGSARLLALFALVWSADTAAYFAGRQWGKTRLASRVSPGKTWVGAFAAVGAAVAVSLAMRSDELSNPPVMTAMIAAVVALAAIIGDLFESLMKRRLGMKDSGALLPGHGGVLDRIDGLVAAAPVYAACLLMQDQIR